MSSKKTTKYQPLVAVVPAAGIGKRMQATCPKQYLRFANKTLLEHTIERLLSHPNIDEIILVLNANDSYFSELAIAKNAHVKTVIGGDERVDSVLAGLHRVDKNSYPWVLVHDAARPCVTHQDITKLIEHSFNFNTGGLLAMPVRDTMKRAKCDKNLFSQVDFTEQRTDLWHALTPQMYKIEQLISAIEYAKRRDKDITDESSAIEYYGLPSALIEGRSDNIKVTRPDDLALAEFILLTQQRSHL